MILENTTSFCITLLSGSSLDYYPENSLSKFRVKLPYTLDFTKNNWEVGITKFAYTCVEETSVEKYDFICIYTDIIKPVIIGHQISRVLLMRPVFNNAALKHRTFNSPTMIEYCRIEPSEISEINILLADTTGEQINLIQDTFQTMVVLHFRRV